VAAARRCVESTNSVFVFIYPEYVREFHFEKDLLEVKALVLYCGRASGSTVDPANRLSGLKEFARRSRRASSSSMRRFEQHANPRSAEPQDMCDLGGPHLAAVVSGKTTPSTLALRWRRARPSSLFSAGLGV